MSDKHCNCRSDIEAKLLERFKADAPEADGHKATLNGYAFIIGTGVTSKACLPIELTANFPLKKGGVKSKTIKRSMIATFCPFCGKRYEPDEVTA